MNITFMKSLIISFGFHALAISLFFMEGEVYGLIQKDRTHETIMVLRIDEIDQGNLVKFSYRYLQRRKNHNPLPRH